MTFPTTTGQLRTKVSEMEIGDYIKFQVSPVTTTSTIFNIGSDVTLSDAAEITIAGLDYSTVTASTGKSGFLYLVKVAKGLLVADRIGIMNINWDTLNSKKIIQGLLFNADSIIPKMTSNTAPSGVVESSGEVITGNEAWKAFDRASTTSWYVASKQAQIGYDFNVNKTIRQYSITSTNVSSGTGNTPPQSWTFEGWNGTTWVVLDTQTDILSWVASERKTFSIPPANYSKYRLNITSNYNGSGIGIKEIEMFDTVGIIRSLTGGVAYAGATGTNIIPTMTSNTAPSGVASASSNGGGSYNPYQAFDKQVSSSNSINSWASGAGFPQWLSYEFSEKKTIQMYALTVSLTGMETLCPKDWTFEGSNDGTTWEVLDTRTGITGWSIGTKRTFSISNPKSFKTYRIKVTAANGGSQIVISEMEMIDKLNFISSTTDQGLGGWPTNNEWDTFIVNFPKDKIQAGKTLDDVFHWSSMEVLTQDTPAYTGALNTDRTTRGFGGLKGLRRAASSYSASTIGFRPVFEYTE